MSPSPFNYPEETRPFIFAKTLAFPIQLETDLGVLRLPAPAAPKMEDGNEKRLWYLEALYFRRWDGKLSHLTRFTLLSHYISNQICTNAARTIVQVLDATIARMSVMRKDQGFMSSKRSGEVSMYDKWRILLEGRQQFAQLLREKKLLGDRLGKALSQLESATHHPPPSQSLTPSDPFLLPAVLPPQIPYPGRSYPVSRPFELPFAPSAEIVLSTDYLFRLVKLMAEHNKRVVPEVCYKACKIAWIDDSRMMRVVGCERGSVGVGPVGRVGSQLSGVRPDVKDVERREGAGVAKNDSEVEQKGPTQMEKGRKGNVEKAPQRKETPQRTFESSSKGAANNDSDSSSDSDADGPHDNEFKGTNSSSSTFTTPSTSTTATFTGTKTPVDSASDNDNENDDENGAASYSDTEIGTSRIRAADLRGKNKCFGDGTSARGKGWSRRWVDVSFGWAWTAEDEEDEEDWAA